jgi:galactose-1-phosphate uridylyltransferase family 2
MTEQTQLAWDIIETTNTNLFLTGKAGTGKTTFLRRLKEESSKRIVVVAPTGIAAINAEGVTIHSFFQLSFAPFIPNYNLKEQQFRFSKQKINVIRSIDTLVIDEISMVRRGRIAKDLKWTYASEYGTLDITINRSKPEKDPRDIAAAKSAKASAYPKCQLCPENAGFAGNLKQPARQNLRPVSLQIQGEPWQLQYSPYGYYHEHCIVFNEKHTAMKIDAAVFEKLFDVLDILPHYFIGSNADLPIVGGSILSHEHFQGGNYSFAMAKAPIEKYYVLPQFPNVQVGIVKWPMSVIRLQSSNRSMLAAACSKILEKWRTYSDASVQIRMRCRVQKLQMNLRKDLE